MKRTARFCVSAGCLLLLIALCWGFKKTLLSACISESCVFTFDAYSSQQFQHDVCDFAQHLNACITCDPAHHCDALKKQFPLINSLEAELTSNGSCFISVKMAQPVCLVNGDIIIAAPGIKGSPQSYEPTVLTQLPHLTCAVETLQSWSAAQICSLALTLSPEVICGYDIVLNEYPELNLINKERPQLHLQARADLFNASDILLRANAVDALLTDRGAFAAKKRRQWVADMRFVKQIVLKVN